MTTATGTLTRAAGPCGSVCRKLTPHIMAYYYNANVRRNGGKLDAVFNIKNVPGPVLSTLVRDFEMSQAAPSNRIPGRRTPASAAGITAGRFSRATSTARLSRWFDFLST